MDPQRPQRHPQAPAAGEPLPCHYVGCFGCGTEHDEAHGGMGMVFNAGEGLAVRGSFTPSPHHQGAPGIAHGGILAAAMDELLGSLNWLLMAPSVTIRLDTRFLLPVPIGTTLALSAEIVEVAGRTVASEGRGELPDGRTAVTAQGWFRQVRPEHFARHGTPEFVAGARGDSPWRAPAAEPRPTTVPWQGSWPAEGSE